jgi:tripeptide aminopeptidase
MISAERLAETFKAMVRIDSVSRDEARFAGMLQARLAEMGIETFFDDSASRTGSNTGNLIARVPGTIDTAPLLLSAHMDTVTPGQGITPVLHDGVFTSDGTTILGSDDKSAIAILLEVLQVLKTSNRPHPPLELVFSTCEEIGLLGAKYLDYSLIRAPMGYVLDTRDPDGIVTRAPSANRLKFEIIGKEAHAGSAPEKGINAILLAARAIAGVEVGRLDEETTCNLGTIQGGEATNIVPRQVVVEGEVRSHDEGKLARVTERVVGSFRNAVASYEGRIPEMDCPRVEVSVQADFTRTHIPDDHAIVKLARLAADRLDRALEIKTAGGGSDANVFFQHGIYAGVLGTGMQDVHTLQENIALADMVKTVELVIEIINCYGAGDDPTPAAQARAATPGAPPSQDR